MVCSAVMSLDDRDYYREELARKGPPRHTQRRRHVLPALALATLAGIVAATPLVMTPRFTYAESWQALAERVVGNSQCSRIGGLNILVRTTGCPR